MIIVVCNEKGGAGKSSLSQTLAVYLKQKRVGELLLIDSDPQRTTAEWSEERSNEGVLEQIPCIELTGNISATLRDLDSKYDYIVIDCGGADSKAMRSALANANVALLPFRPKRRDLKVAPSMAEIIDEVMTINESLKVFSCVTQAPTMPNQKYRIDSARTLLEKLNLAPLESETRNLNAWDDAEESGHSVLEWKADIKAGEDAKKLFDELFQRLEA